MSTTLSTRRRMRRAAALPVALAAVALALAGCGEDAGDGGESTEATPDSAVSADPALAALVPADVSADGTITVGSDASYAPAEFLDTDGQTVIGFDVDLFSAVAAKLGLEAEFVNAPFGSIIVGVGSNKYEVGVSSFTINAERLEQANMVSYFSAGTQWATVSGNAASIDPDDACGQRIAVQKDTVQVEDITARSQACTDAGKEAIQVDQYTGQDQATASVVSGKDDAMLADSPVAAYAVQQTDGELELVGDIYDSAPYGYVVPKDQTEFAQAVADAVQAIIDDGAYGDVLEEWGVEQGAITDPTVNPQA